MKPRARSEGTNTCIYLTVLGGKLQAARSFIQKGCDACPKSEDIWVEAARVNTPENARAILARAVVALPNSVKIWMQAAQLESTAGTVESSYLCQRLAAR